ncbi:2-oxoglutarate dehydrogenase, E2 component, dihydrolipoamide succinyltransferase [Brevibacterium sp. 5221]|uniref:Dihydrolipoamide acetyltransferase component of pyruvate dehydrogenase complex n=1 Tax=Brevibacterium rongguiense TaxID=2695267 RepID=A0A6N9HBT1_9MICO|nr:2-oxoglutarate dehydrogenase, E2 component, dihydrolipoamide succinyltransferase [Brevibacterium rongguiense]MYM20914.1 2-oxoglutarate dehydrogenase, E2 component, dihydrolipoamide succinyltransferase [Brevibacterium rongguiense]
MSNTVQMPALGESVTEGTVTRWLKEVGDDVEVDEPLLEVSTDKVDTEIPSPYAGKLEKILAEEDDEVEVGGDLAVIGDGSGSDASDSGDSGQAASQDAEDSQGSGEDANEEYIQGDQDTDSDPSSPVAEDDAQSGSLNEVDASLEDEDDSAPADGGADSSGSGGASGSGESTDVTMPALGESVTEGTVTRWLKQVGDEVEVDEPLLEVSTDKVDTEIPSPVAGTVLELLAEEDEEVEVGGLLARVGSGSPASSGSSSDDGADQESAQSGEQDAEDSEPAQSDSQEAQSEQAQSQQSGEAEQQKAAAEEQTAQEDAQAQGSQERKPAADERSQAPSGDKPEQKSEQKSEGSAERSASISQAVQADASAYVTPLVRKLAREKGIDLSAVHGTGVGGRIRKQDVLAAAERGTGAAGQAQQAAGAQAAGAAQGGQREPYRLEIPEEAQKLRGTTQKAPRIRQTIAARMRESLQNSAQLTQTTEADMTRVSKLRKANKDAFQAKHGVKLTYLPFFAKAIVEALQIHPTVNAHFDIEAKQITYFENVNLAVAVDTPRGLLVPVVKNAQDLSIAGLAKAIDDVAERTRNGKIAPDDLSDGTFTVTNIGSFGALFDTPIINVPQAGILGTGTIQKRPVVVKDADGDDAIAIRDMVYLPLTYNHELVDGADAGRFLKTIKERLEDANFQADLDL